MRLASCSATSTPTCPRSRRCSPTSRRPASTRSGASATSSATAPSPTSAPSSSRERCALCLVGNHDLAVARASSTSRPSRPPPRPRSRWTRERDEPTRRSSSSRGLEPADEEPRGRRSTTPRRATRSGSTCSGPTRPRECIRAQARAGELRSATPTSRSSSPSPTAAPASERRRPRRPGRRRAPSLDVGRGRWLINPGSVGQPRDGDPRAAWLELDTETWKATYHRVEYDIDRAADAIIAAGLPEHLARRLYVGQ